VAAILFYLAKRFPEAELLPDGGIEGEAQALSWMSFIASTIHPSRAKGHQANMEAFSLAEQRLGGRAWALERYSIADIHLFRLYWRLKYAEQVPAGTFPGLEAHYARMMARPAVQRTIAVEAAVGYELP
jgi:glutathione S-transferase